MTTCTKCKKEFEEAMFKNDKGKIFKTCENCRNICKEWRKGNRERVSLYNKNLNQIKSTKSTCTIVYAKKVVRETTGDANDAAKDEWLKFNSQLAAAKSLGLYTANINKVIKGHLKTTGGYVFKIEEQKIVKVDMPSWETVKKEHNIEDQIKGKPSKQRIIHETRDNIVGKVCCSCKEWKALDKYNNSKTHWDKLRNGCKDCLVKWRKDNRQNIQKTNTLYEKKRKLTDPEFKIMKTLRSRLGSALKNQNARKSQHTLDLIGCSIPFLLGYLEAKFTSGMTWENHGKWHIDHIKPCASFNLLDKEEQQKCFYYTNLQPLWAVENLQKGSLYENNRTIEQ